jgi:uncharacterized protein (DUF2236 family)
VHRGLAGVEPESGVAYQVEDTSLLLWVHCAQVDSFLDAYRRCGGRLRRGEADAYVGEQARAAALVGVPAEDVPVTTGELRRYLDSVRPQLRASGEARAALWFLFNPPMPLAARPAWMYLTGLAFGLLPRWRAAPTASPARCARSPAPTSRRGSGSVAVDRPASRAPVHPFLPGPRGGTGACRRPVRSRA